MLSSILGAVAPIAGKFIMKNSGKLVGSATKAMKDSKYKWLNKAGDFVGSAINKASGFVGEGEIKKQLENATKAAKGENVDFNFNLEDSKKKEQHNESAQPTTALAFYNKNLGGTNFKPYKSKRKKFKRVNVKGYKITHPRGILPIH